MEDLENKIQEELTLLKNQLAKIETDSTKFTDLDQLRIEMGERRNHLILEQQDLCEKKNEMQAQVNRLQVQCDTLQVSRFNATKSNSMSKFDFTFLLFDVIRMNWKRMKLT